MNCTKCKAKECRDGIDCNDDKNVILPRYQETETHKIITEASLLIDNGRAGTLSRVEELIEFIKGSNYKKIGLAYCIGLEKSAIVFSELLKKNKIKHAAVCCITDGITEAEIDPAKENFSVSCNPIGQAEQLKKDGVDLVIEIGLCLGHDILFHREIKCDLTVLVVKDRKYNHCPLAGLKT